MEKIIGDFSTELRVSLVEAEKVCKLGAGEKCCAFLVCGMNGFECVRMSYPTSASIFTRLEEGTIAAKGIGGNKGCAWECEI